jgi:uncharacterized membrane protein (UPF0127 family)
LVVIAAIAVTVAMSVTTLVTAKPIRPPWRLQLPWQTETTAIVVGSDHLTVEIADTLPLQHKGLGYRDRLEPGTGMLFVYDEPGKRTFWMKGMRFCLDIVWIESGTIVGAAVDVCPSPGVSDAKLPRFNSPEPVTYVLEVPAGWLADHGYGAGTPVQIGLDAD